MKTFEVTLKVGMDKFVKKVLQAKDYYFQEGFVCLSDEDVIKIASFNAREVISIIELPERKEPNLNCSDLTDPKKENEDDN